MISEAPSSTSLMPADKLISQLCKMAGTSWIHSILLPSWSYLCVVCEGFPFTTFGGNTCLSSLLIDSWHLSEPTFISSYFPQPASNMFCSSPWLFGAFATTSLLRVRKEALRVYNDISHTTSLCSRVISLDLRVFFRNNKGEKSPFDGT